MPEEILEEPWYRCVRCRAMFKLKGLIIRHLILHKVHRFENDCDTKCAEDWERVRVVGGTVLKVDLPKEDDTLPQSGHNHQQTSWILEPSTGPLQPGTTQTQTYTLIAVNNDNSTTHLDSSATTDYLGPFDPIISQTFLKFDTEGGGGPISGTVVGTRSNESNSSSMSMSMSTSTGDGTGIDFPTTENLYRCRYCSAPFAHSRSRSVHEAKVHNEEMIDGYSCQICTKNFPTIASVQDHYRCTHKLTPPVKKAWKLWKTHGGNVNDYVEVQHQVLTSLTPSANSLPEVTPQNIGIVELGPVSREVDSSLGLGLDVTLTGSGTESSQEQQQEFESYYFQTDEGPIPITLTTTPTPTSTSSNNNSQIFITSQTNTKFIGNQHSLGPSLKQKRKNTKKDSGLIKKKVISTTKTKPKVNKPAPKSTAISIPSDHPPSSSTSPKLPKDSPFRYQRLKCAKCEKRFRTQWELILHLGQIHAEFSCCFCPLVFSSKVEMVRHQYTTHNTELGYYTCRCCRQNFGSPRIVQEHVHSQHPGARVPSTSVALKWRRA